MPDNNKKCDSRQHRHDKLQARLTALDKELAEKQVHYAHTEKQLLQRKAQFHAVQRKLEAAARAKRTFIRFFRSAAAYVLGRRNIKQLYSRAYKQKKAENELKKYKYYLYELGFTEKALADLESLYDNPVNHYQKRAAAWELALWHSGKYSKEGAFQALQYLSVVTNKEKDEDRLRRAAILKAECHDILQEAEAGKRVINEALSIDNHPDLYLARANLERSIEERVRWINKVMDLYDLQSVHFDSDEENVNYNDLRTTPIDKK